VFPEKVYIVVIETYHGREIVGVFSQKHAADEYLDEQKVSGEVEVWPLPRPKIIIRNRIDVS
jgi:hypothetical protein